ncbi:MAG: hypothetical protein V1779_08475 [bacterium]
MKTQNIFLLLILLLIVSCESTQEPKKDIEFQLIGSVNFRLIRKSAIGMTLGEFNCSYYLSGTKIELLSNDEVVGTTYTVADTTCDIFYVFKDVEYNKPYKIRMTLNDEMVEYSSEFTIKKEDVKMFPYDSLTQLLKEQHSWIQEGYYYTNLLLNKEGNVNFDLYANDSLLDIYPNPITSTGEISFPITNEASVEVSIHSIDKTYFYLLLRDNLKPGFHSLQFGDNLEDGLYFVKIIAGVQVYNCPFLKGRKGAPEMP